jgi:hypothetical protein
VKRGSFKASELQPGHKATPADAAAALDEHAEGRGDYVFIAPAPPLVGGLDGTAGTLPEGIFFIGVGIFMMEVMSMAKFTLHNSSLAPRASRLAAQRRHPLQRRRRRGSQNDADSQQVSTKCSNPLHHVTSFRRLPSLHAVGPPGAAACC